jgi:hypothetical protein
MTMSATAPHLYAKGDGRAAQGARRMRELAAEAAAEITALMADLLSGLGRTPSATDRITAEAIAAATVRARKLRALGRDDFEERKQIAQLMRAAGQAFKPAAPAAEQPYSIEAALRARGYTPPGEEHQNAETATSEDANASSGVSA